MRENQQKAELTSDPSRDTDKDIPSFGLSAVILVAANLIPLFGALIWGWSVFDIVVLYWVENVIVGFINAIRLMFITNREGGVAAFLEKGFTTGFFLVHYGIFTLVHGIFVFSLLGGGFPGNGQKEDPGILFDKLGWAVLALIGSHLLSFFVNFLGRKEYEKRTLKEQMFAPYPRMIALHIAIVFGAFAIQALGQPIVLLAILVIGKTLVDWKLHLKSHRELEEAA